MYDPAVIEAHRPIMRQMAAEDMALLKNDYKHLPFKENSKIAVFGRNQIDFLKGGLGSADVFCGNAVNLLEALESSENSSVISIDKNLSSEYRKNLDYIPTDAVVKKCAETNDYALWVIGRNSVEGLDRKAEAGTYKMSVRTATIFDTVSLEVTLDDVSCGFIKVNNTNDWQKYQTTGDWILELPEGECELKLYTRATNVSGFANIGRIIIEG